MRSALTTGRSPQAADTDLLLTHLITSGVDAQRGYQWEPDPGIVANLAASAVEHGARVVLLHDAPLTGDVPEGVETFRVEPRGVDVYWERWYHTRDFLRAADGLERVFCVDASDVLVLRPPFEGIEPGVLYIGSEASTVGNRWMRRVHPHPELQRFIEDHSNDVLLNCGLVGGTRETVLEYVEDVVAAHHTLSGTGDAGLDMGLTNYAAYSRWADRLQTGPSVHTQFKKFETSHPTARFAHK